VEKWNTNLTAISFHPCTANTKQGKHNGISFFLSFFRGLHTTISALRFNCVVLAHGKQEDSTIRPSNLPDISHPLAGQKTKGSNRKLVDYSALLLFTLKTFVRRLFFIYGYFISLYMLPRDHVIAKIRKQMVMAYLKVFLFQGSTILSCSWKNKGKSRDIC
jgi:hypothetical protein